MTFDIASGNPQSGHLPAVERGAYSFLEGAVTVNVFNPVPRRMRALR